MDGSAQLVTVKRLAFDLSDYVNFQEEEEAAEEKKENMSFRVHKWGLFFLILILIYYL